jgi:hypothetical protein
MDLGLLSYFALKLHFAQLLIDAPPLPDSDVSQSPLPAFAPVYQIPFHFESLRDFCARLLLLSQSECSAAGNSKSS